MDFKDFDKKVDLSEMKEEIKAASENGTDYKEVPFGKYEVSVDKMELVMTKAAPERPMLSIWYKVLSGDFKGSLIFSNMVLMTKNGQNYGFLIHRANETLRALVDNDLSVEFESFAKYDDLICDISEHVDGKFEYAIDFKEVKGYSTVTIEEVFEVE